MRPIVYLDTETLGLDEVAPIWEFAAVRREENRFTSEHFFIRHDPSNWLHDLPQSFRDDYSARYSVRNSIPRLEAAKRIFAITQGAMVVGAVPSFDTIRLTRLLRWANLEPEWHYHLVDVENLAVGYLAAKGALMPPPWNSNDLSLALGVDPDAYERHTAMGDVEWTMAQWDKVFEGVEAGDEGAD